MALAAYRHVLRSIPIAFRGDPKLLIGAQKQARQSFEQGRSMDPGSEEFSKAVEHAESVAVILRQNVVQGQNEGDGEHYKLRIHQETERGDNDSIKMAGQRLKEKPAQR